MHMQGQQTFSMLVHSDSCMHMRLWMHVCVRARACVCTCTRLHACLCVLADERTITIVALVIFNAPQPPPSLALSFSSPPSTNPLLKMKLLVGDRLLVFLLLARVAADSSDKRLPFATGKWIDTKRYVTFGCWPRFRFDIKAKNNNSACFLLRFNSILAATTIPFKTCSFFFNLTEFHLSLNNRQIITEIALN